MVQAFMQQQRALFPLLLLTHDDDLHRLTLLLRSLGPVHGQLLLLLHGRAALFGFHVEQPGPAGVPIALLVALAYQSTSRQ